MPFKEVNLNDKKVQDFVGNARGETSKKPNGRHKKALDELKTERIIIQLTPKQKQEIKDKAKENNLALSQYVIVKIFGLK